MVRCITVLAIVLLGFLGAGGSNDFGGGDAKEVLENLDSHFEKVPPEINRYRSVTPYGETVSDLKPRQDDIDEEIRLFEAAKAAALLKEPPEQVQWLCQNLLIFAPKTGVEFLRELADQTTMPESIRYCSVFAAGRPGEQIAVEKLKSPDVATRQWWSSYLRANAILDESAEPMIQAIQREANLDVKANLLMGLGMLNGKSACNFLEDQMNSATDDKVQAAAIFAYVEAAGFHGFTALERVKPVGTEAAKEKEAGIQYLRDETTALSPNGFEVGNDQEFVARFGDLVRCPAIAWLEKHGLLEDDAVRHSKKLNASDKAELLKLLIDAKGFGLEAVKGTLFLSVLPSDVDQLVAMRAATWYSPNPFSKSRTKTIGILIRQAGKWSGDGAGGAKGGTLPESADALDGPPHPDPKDLETEIARNDLTNSIGTILAKIPAGEFQMGNDESIESLVRAFPYAKRAWFENASVRHNVRLTREFYLGKFEVTVGEFRKFVEATGYVTNAEKDEEGGGGFDEVSDEFRRGKEFTWRNVGWPQTDLHPVLNITWHDAIEFCRWLSDKEKKEYRLPTEAEWEYACRAGTRTRYQNGNDPKELPAVANISDNCMKQRFPRSNNTIAGNDGFAFTAPVGMFRPNRFGLHDMHGNVLEWCADWYGNDYYRRSPTDNPPGPSSGPGRVVKGGAFGINAARCRSAEREWFLSKHRGDYLGFRVALSIEP